MWNLVPVTERGAAVPPSPDPFLPGLVRPIARWPHGHFTAVTGEGMEAVCELPGCGSELRAVAHPQHGHHLLQLFVEKVDEALLPLDEDGPPDDLALAVGDEFVEPLDLLVQLCQRLLMHVDFAVGVGDVQGGLGDIAVDF